MASNKQGEPTILDAVSVVAAKLSDSGLSFEATEDFLQAEKQLNEYFSTTTGETWMLCGIISYYFKSGETCSFNDLSNVFDVPVISLLAHKKDIDGLLAKGYIHNKWGLDEDIVGLKNEFELVPEILLCLLDNKELKIVRRKKEGDFIVDMIKRMGDLIESPTDIILKRIQIYQQEKKYASNSFISRITESVPNMLARIFFYNCCSDLLQGNQTNLSTTIRYVYPEDLLFVVADTFLKEEHPLLKQGLVEFETKGSLSNSTLRLTNKAKVLLLGENAKYYMEELEGTNIIQPESVHTKELFYSLENEREITRLKNSLQEENLVLIQKGLAEQGLPKGITILFYGESGTGKTESVYQIAKETGRKIIQVDISTVKSCWFGESEKNIKKIFSNYHQICKDSRLEREDKLPILLFNEADGILSKRKDVNLGNLTHTENAVQNIILEEMEKLEGIMICTTNFFDNLDTAFERRFLFKLQFENPSTEVKKKIWKSKLHWLSEEQVEKMAQGYDLSGGQIDNIVRKITLDTVLGKEKPNTQELIALCQKEKLGKQEQSIGFF